MELLACPTSHCSFALNSSQDGYKS
uniref:Uncharacterized protein n=1 Tax=Arundo donax TaxID=35708 RepID=A0A0A9BEZ4_ARUDO